MRGSIPKTASALALAALLPVALACDSGDQEAGDAASQQQGQPPAGQQQQQPPSGQQQAPQIEVEEDELRAFTEAQVEIEGLRGEYQTRLQEAEGQEEARQIEQEANEEMVGVVEDQGLDVQRYTQIARAIDSDPDLRQRFMELRQELSE